jgi:hypothetical protein
MKFVTLVPKIRIIGELGVNECELRSIGSIFGNVALLISKVKFIDRSMKL